MRRRPVATVPATGRPFTPAELARIRHLLAHWDDQRVHPRPGVDELHAIHAAAGRRRAFKVWELDPLSAPEDFGRAYEEEVTE